MDLCLLSMTDIIIVTWLAAYDRGPPCLYLTWSGINLPRVRCLCVVGCIWRRTTHDFCSHEVLSRRPALQRFARFEALYEALYEDCSLRGSLLVSLGPRLSTGLTCSKAFSRLTLRLSRRLTCSEACYKACSLWGSLQCWLEALYEVGFEALHELAGSKLSMWLVPRFYKALRGSLWGSMRLCSLRGSLATRLALYEASLSTRANDQEPTPRSLHPGFYSQDTKSWPRTPIQRPRAILRPRSYAQDPSLGVYAQETTPSSLRQG